MSYCRFGEYESDVYVVRTGDILKCFCNYPGSVQDSEVGMIDHLSSEHVARGERVPQRALDRLLNEHLGIPHKTDVEQALEDWENGFA